MGATKSTHRLRVAALNPFVPLQAAAIGAVFTIAGASAVAQQSSERVTSDRRTIQPQVLDFSWKNRQKAESKQLLQDARDAAKQGKAQRARDLIHRASELPVNWYADDESPETLSEELDSIPKREATRPGRDLEEIPSVSDLAEPASEDESRTTRFRGGAKQRDQRSTHSSGNADDVSESSSDSLTAPPSTATFLPNPDSALETLRSAKSASRSSGFDSPANGDRGREFIILHAASANEVQEHERTVSATSVMPMKGNASTPEPTIANLSSLLLAALLGAVVMMVGLLLVLLKKFGPNPTFVFKVEMTNSGREAAVTDRSASPALRIAPIYAMKMQMEEEQERQREEAMMQKVFEDNLELREQLETTRQAA